MSEPLKQRPFEAALGGQRLELLGRRKVVPAWQREPRVRDEDEAEKMRRLAAADELPRPEVATTAPAEPAGNGDSEMAAKKKRKAVSRLSAVQVAELQRRARSEPSAALIAEFGISSSTYYKHVKKAAPGKPAQPVRPGKPKPDGGDELATVELLGAAEALARFVDARVERKLSEAFARMRGGQ